MDDKEEPTLRELIDSLDTSTPIEWKIVNNIYTYKITGTITERSICGKTRIIAECIEDKITVEINISNSKRNKRNYIKKKLNIEHAKLLKDKTDNKFTIDVGDML